MRVPHILAGLLLAASPIVGSIVFVPGGGANTGDVTFSANKVAGDGSVFLCSDATLTYCVEVTEDSGPNGPLLRPLTGTPISLSNFSGEAQVYISDAGTLTVSAANEAGTVAVNLQATENTTFHYGGLYLAPGTATLKAGGGSAGETEMPLKAEADKGIFLGPANFSQPTCDSTARFALWTSNGTAGNADSGPEICEKSAADAYSWRELYREGATDVAIADGGTGQSTATDAFDALAPTTTQGDILYHNGTANVRLAKGTAGQILQMNAGATAPEWAATYTAYESLASWVGTATQGVPITITNSLAATGTNCAKFPWVVPASYASGNPTIRIGYHAAIGAAAKGVVLELRVYEFPYTANSHVLGAAVYDGSNVTTTVNCDAQYDYCVVPDIAVTGLTIAKGDVFVFETCRIGSDAADDWGDTLMINHVTLSYTANKGF